MPAHSPLSAQAASALFALPEQGLYLDCASQGPPLRAARRCALEMAASDAFAWAGDVATWRERIEALRLLAARLFDGDGDGIAFLPSAGHGLSIAAMSLPLEPRQGVLVLDGQFPSNLLPWRERCEERGARLVVATRVGHEDWTTAVLRTLDAEPGVAILALPQAHWIDGSLLDLARISAQARAMGARLVLDLSQSLGVLPVDLDAWQPDFVAGVGYKWLLGPYGLAYLWVAPRWRASAQAVEHGWMGHDTPELWQEKTTATAPALAGARRLDAGGVCDARRLALAHIGLTQVLDWGDGLAPALGERVAALADALRGHGCGDWLPPGGVAHFCGLKPPPQVLDALLRLLEDEGVACTQRRGRIRLAPHLHVDPAAMRSLGERLARCSGAG